MARSKYLTLVSGTTAALLLLSYSSATAGIISDPLGDTFGVGAVQIDITSYSVDANTPGQLHFHATFGNAEGIAPASLFAANSVLGYIDLDTDANAATGTPAFVNVDTPLSAGLPPVNLGDEFYIDIGSEQDHPGMVDVVDAANNIVGEGTITFDSSAISSFFDVFVDLSLLPGAGNTINSGIIVGTYGDATSGGPEMTDRAPNGSTPDTLSTPEPASLTMLGIGVLSLGGYVWRRRKAG